MIYLNNSSDIQQIYIPRQEIKKDAVSKYVTENELRDALANETARTEETYQKIADMSAYTQTSGFATINGQIITNGGNIEIDGAIYSAGTNINIDENNVISVTGITVPTKLSDLENDEGFITSGDIPTSNTAFTNDAGYLTTADTQDFVTSADVKTQVEAYNYVDSGDVQTQINESISGKADSSAVTAQISDVKAEIEAEIPSKVSDLQNDLNFASTGDVESMISGFTTSADVKTQIESYNYINSGQAQTQIDNSISGKVDTSALTQYYTSAETNTAIDNAVSGKMDTSGMTAYATTAFTEETYIKETSLEGLFDGVEYVSSAKTIYFYDKDNTEVGTIDTTDFVKDGMVDNVYISGDTLYIVFNTDAGKETIEIALTDIFNPANYYTKSEVDSAITAATAATTGWVSEQGYLTEHQSLSAYSTTEQMNTAIENATSGKVDTSAMTAYWTSAETESAITSATEDFVTSADVETQITDKGYITGYTETDPVFQSSPASGISAQDILNWDAKLDSSDLEPYYTSGETNTAIANAVSGKADADTFTAYTPTSGFATINGSAITEGGNLVIQGGSGATYSAGANIDISAQNEISVTGITSYTGITSGDITTALGYTPISGVDLTDYYTSAQTDTAISNATSGKQDTLVSGVNIKTINNESLLGSGNIVISGGSGGSANIIELTQAEYDALTAYTEDAMYVITDAQEINMDNYATTGDLGSYYTSAETDTAISNAVSGKTDKVSVTANTGRQFPRWNSQGVVTGTTGNTVYEQSLNINGTSKTMLQTTNSSFGTIYAPTSAGSQGQPLLSNGSGAPVWGSYKFQFISQSAYDAITTKDSTTIYFIISEN